MQPPLYLVKEVDNTVFPSESTGQFHSSSLTPNCTYDVFGTEPTPAQSVGPSHLKGALCLLGPFLTAYLILFLYILVLA